MKKFSIAAAAALAITSAAPAIAQETTVAADPFVSTQGEPFALGVIGGVTLLVLIAAANDSSSGTD